MFDICSRRTQSITRSVLLRITPLVLACVGVPAYGVTIIWNDNLSPVNAFPSSVLSAPFGSGAEFRVVTGVGFISGGGENQLWALYR